MTSTSPPGPSGQQAPEALHIRLYVAGESPNSLAATSNLHKALGKSPSVTVHLEVIDIIVEPERGTRDGVSMTPMLVKVRPLPERRVLGNLRDLPMLLEILGLEQAAHD